MFFSKKPADIPQASEALAGRSEEMQISNVHHINGTPLKPPFPEGLQTAIFGLGCFWGAERKFWQVEGVYTTAVGYAGGHTVNADYHEVCSGRTGHTEVVLVVYDPEKVSYQSLLKMFWELHNPTQGMQQGNDVGTQYRSAIYTYGEQQLEQALASKQDYESKLKAEGFPAITTEIEAASDFYYAEEAHQQYLAKNPSGYCGLKGTGVSCSI